MSRFLRFWYICLFSGSLISQNLNVAWHGGIDNIGHLSTINSKIYFWERTLSPCCADQLTVRGLSPSGSTIWSRIFNYWESNVPLSMISTHDDCLAITFTEQGCDLGPKLYHLVKLDTNGNTVYHFTHKGRFGAIVDYPDSTLFTIAADTMFRFSKSGSLLSKISVGIGFVNSMSVLNNGNLLVNGQINSVIKNIELTIAGAIISQTSSSPWLVKTYQTPSGIVVAKAWQSDLKTFNSNLTALASSTTHITDFIVRNDSVFVVGFDGHAFYKILDLNFNVLYSTSSTNTNLYPVSISINSKNEIDVIAGVWGGSMPFRSLFKFPLNGTFLPGPDIGVSSFTVTSAHLYEYSQYRYYGDMSLDVTVKNYGSDTIHSFYLNHYAATFLCHLYYHQIFSVILAPGDSAVVQTGTLSMNPVQKTSPLASLSYMPVRIFTTIPDAQVDSDANNDFKVDSVLVTVTGLEDELSLSNQIQIYPNPSNESFNVSSTLDISSIKIFNATGQLLIERKTGGNIIEIKDEALAPGVYFIHLQTDKGSVVKKLLIE